jgi:hypothetical protein
MKKIKVFFLALIIGSGLTINAQTKTDSLAIEKAARDYVEGWQSGDGERVARGVSQELVKRTIGKDQEGNCFLNNMGASLLIFVSERNKDGVRTKDLKPNEEFKLEVNILDITGDYALVKTVAAKYGFFDYCQIGKVNGEWKIINVLWGMLPQELNNQQCYTLRCAT